MDVREQLEAGFAAEPAHRPIDERLEAGRRALRRRRVVSGSAALAVVAVLAGGYAVAGPGSQPRGTEPPASAPSRTASAPPSLPASPVPDPTDGKWARLVDGEVVLADGVTEVRRIDAGGRKVGLELQLRDQTVWYLVTPSGSSSFTAYVSFESLEDWVADQQQGQGGRPPSKPFVDFGPDGTLRPMTDAVSIVEQRADPELPDNYDAGVATAVAEVLVDGKTYYVLARDPERPDYIAVPASIGGADLDAFLDYARQRYAGGEGLR